MNVQLSSSQSAMNTDVIKEPDDSKEIVDKTTQSATELPIADKSSHVSTVDLESMEVEPYVAQDVLSADAELGVCGLYNLGNTCYMNSSLQCLLHDRTLREHFLFKLKNLRYKEEGLFQEVVGLYNKYWDGQCSVIVPRKFKNVVGMVHPQFDGFGQHDGQEFLALFLASLHQELKLLDQQISECGLLENNSSKSLSVSDDKNFKRKRTGGVIDDSVPNNKRIDSSNLSKQYLTLTSFIGKEKKTANVNVLNTEVECDEEITTDHSNKFPQTVSHFNSEVYLNEAEMNNQPRQRHKSEGHTSSNFVEQIKDLQLKQLKQPNHKQTNVIADIQRHVVKDLVAGDSPKSDIVCKVHSSEIVCKSAGDVTSFEKSLKQASGKLEKLAKLASISQPGVCAEEPSSVVFPAVLENILPADVKESSYISCLGCLYNDQNLLKQSKKNVLASKNEQKDFSSCDFDQPDLVLKDEKCDDILTACDIDQDKLTEVDDISEEKGSFTTKFTNIFSDEINKDCSDRLSPEVVDADEDLQDHASNIRGDICSGSSETKPSVADESWLKYIQQNRSVIVDTLHGQLESTVVCCKCSHKSTTYEPFMYLSVPIPYALQRTFTIGLLPLDAKPSVHTVFAMKEGTVEDLCQALSAKLQKSSNSVDLSSYNFCEVKENGILKVLESKMLLKSINTTTRQLQAIQFVDVASEENNAEDGGKTSWNSCCICLEDLADPELLKHSSESCSVLMCQTCLQSSVAHYGLDNFSCPICHVKCDPSLDFVQLANSSQNRIVVLSVSFICMNGNNVKLVAPSRLLRTSTALTNNQLHSHVRQMIPAWLLAEDVDYKLGFCTLDGASCSRCDVTSVCTGCTFLSKDDDVVTFLPGDNISVRFSKTLSFDNSSISVGCAEEQTQSIITLENCLAAFAKNEILDDSNPWFCPTCECNRRAEKRLRVVRWPNTLIVYIKRFLYHGKNAVKVDDEVLFPLEAFNPGPISGTDAIHSKLYDLNSCVSHFGGVYSGHYTSHCKHPCSGKWHYYNDENVSLQEPSSKDAAATYVLFYKERAPNI